MSKLKTNFVCSECDYSSPKWLGRCPDCKEWNTLEEVSATNNKGLKIETAIGSQPKKIKEIKQSSLERYLTGLNEFDRTVGGGLVKGSLTLLGGAPGVGKSTLLMEVLANLSRRYCEEIILYISGEESESQVAQRSLRLKVNCENLLILNETNWQKIIEVLKNIKPTFLVIDSIQTTVSSELSSIAGSPSQVKEITHELMNFTKTNGITSFVIGHVTKDGGLAGPKVLEHMVDSVLSFEGDGQGQNRILRVIKNRFGCTNEIGIFEISGKGLREVKNTSSLFLDDASLNSYGRSLTCSVEGSRPLIIETQALVVENKFGNGKRITQGIECNRLSLLLAIVDKYFGVSLAFNDIYLNIVGGIKLTARDGDLSILASLLSSFREKKICEGIVFIGEVGLSGEIRCDGEIEKRVKELEVLNYKKIITSTKCARAISKKYKIEIIGIKKAIELESILF